MTDVNNYYAGGLGVDAYDPLLSLNGNVVSGDIDFYLECAREFGDPVLEIATGNGRVLTPLAEAGHEVVGLDLSAAMLRVAEARLKARKLGPPRVMLSQGDMTDFDLGRQFALILIPFRSFQHVTEPEAQRAALRCMHRHLRPGGHLVVNVFDPRFDLLANPQAFVGLKRQVRDPRGWLLRRTIVARDVDFLRQTWRETLLLELFDADGALRKSDESVWTLRWMLRQEMRYLLELSGFEPVAEYSDFKKSPPAYGNEQNWVARKTD